MSGSLVLLSDVGTHMVTTSAAPSALKSPRTSKHPARNAARTLRWHVGDVGTPRPETRDPLAVDVDPGHVEPRPGHRHRLGQAEVTEADDGDARGATLDLAFESHPFSYAAAAAAPCPSSTTNATTVSRASPLVFHAVT